MPKFPDISRLDNPVGPLRDVEEVTIGSDDYEQDFGFICQITSAVASQDITVRTLEGENDIIFNDVTQGTVLGMSTHPVLLRAIRGTSTVTTVLVGRPPIF